MKLSDVSFATPIEILSLTPTTVAIVIATVGEEMINKVLTLKVNFLNTTQSQSLNENDSYSLVFYF